MAKKKNFELDEYGFNTGLEVPDFNFDSPQIKDDRNPTTKIGKAVLSGAKDTMMSPSFIRRVVKEALPRGYGSAMDMADTTAGSLKSLYDTSAREIKPVMNDLKRTTARAMPAIDKVLPGAVARRIKKWSENTGGSPSGMSAEDQRDSAVMAQVGDIFRFQAEQTARQEAEGNVKDRIKDGMEQSRHRDMLGQLDAIRIGIQQVANYQSKVESGFQRKSLELQYRHYFVAIDQLTEQKRMNAIAETRLEGIMKNTGLPDFVKLKTTERMKEAMRNQFLDTVNEGMFEKRRNFIKNMGAKASEMVTSKVQGFMGDIRGGINMADSVMDMREMQAQMGGGPSGGEMLGNVAGGLAMDSMGTKFGKWLGKHLAKNKKLVKNGNKLQYITENFPQIAGEWARSQKGENGGMFDPLVRGVKDMTLSSLDNGGSTANLDSSANMQEPGIYSRQANKSVTEIIPGFLSRIYQELQIMRTGDAKIGLTSYDYTSNKFVGKSVAHTNAFNSLFSADDKASTKDQIEALIREVDDGSLTPEQRTALGKQLLRDNLNNRAGSASRLGDATAYNGDAGKFGTEFAELFQKYFASDATGSKQVNFARQYNQLGGRISDSRKGIQDFANMGLTDFLADAGIMDQSTGKMNLDRVADFYSGGLEYTPGENGMPAAPVNGLPQGRKRRERNVARPQTATDVRGSARNSFGNTSELVEAIKASNTVEQTETMAQTLLRIEARLQEGLITYSGGDATAEGPSGKGWNMTFKDAGKGLLSGGRNLFGRVRKFAQGAFNKVQSAVTSGFGLGSKLLEIGKDRFNKFRDVYIKGELEPRMTAAKLKAGLYYDKASGKVVSTFKDIKGTVVEYVDGIEQVVMSPDEIKRAFVKSRVGQTLITGLGALANMGRGLAYGLTAQLPVLARTVMDAGKAFGGRVMGLLNGPRDVYLKDMYDSPVLQAIIMRAGGYWSQSSGKPITTPSDIDGPVMGLIDGKESVLITTEQLGQGLFDGNGKPLRTGLARITGAAKDLFGKAMGAIKGAGNWVKGKLQAGLSGIGGFFGGLMGPDGIVIAGGKKTNSLLEEIRDILRDRLPKRKSAVGDTDGDGTRDGSYEDIMAERKALAAQAAGKEGGPDAMGAGRGGMGAGLMGMLDKLRGKKDEAEEDDDGFGLDDAGDLADIADLANGDGNGRGRKRRGKGKKGWWSKAKGLGGKITGKGLLKTAGVAGAAYGAYSAYDNIKQGNYGEAALDAGLSVGGLAATGGLGAGAMAGMGAGAMTGLGAVATGLGALLTAPVLLGALAVAAIGAGGYYAYKYATRKTLGMISKVRYAQYGFLSTDEAHLPIVFGLEDMLMPGVVWNGATPTLDDKKVDLKKIVESFGVDMSKPEYVRSWATWMSKRFKPVFLTHLTALKAADPGATLSGVDKLKYPVKKQYFDASKFSEGPYGVLVSPFPDLKQLAAGRSEVDAVMALATAELEKEGKSSADSISGVGVPTPPGLPGDPSGMGIAVMASQGDGISKGPAQALTGPSPSGVDTGGAMTTLTATATGFTRNSSERLDALSCIRYKTYGLRDLAMEKVRSLDALEAVVAKGITYDAAGRASWKGSIDKVLLSVGPSFGVEGVANNKAYDWQAWFNMRFLPTYLNFLSVLRSQTSKDNVQQALAALKPQQAVDVAMVVYTTTGVFNGSAVSVWAVPVSPWPGYALNSDVTSIEGNMQGLKELAKKTILNETVGSNNNADLNGGDKRIDKAGAAPGGNSDQSGAADKGASSGLWGSFKSGVGSAWQSTKNAVSSVFGGSSSPGGPQSPSGGGSMNGGVAVTHPGNGTGGDVNSLPMPKGSGKWEHLKDLILGAAKMAGVDGKLMATMAAIESGFQHSVKAGTSSATGLYQFIKSTWDTMLKKYGAKYGIAPNTPATDPRANALMGAEFIKENAAALKGAVNRPLTDTDLYIAHFMGAGGAKKFLSADPNTIAANFMPEAARANKSIFYGEGGRPLTVGEVYNVINGRVRSKGKQFGIDGSEAITASAPTGGAGAEKLGSRDTAAAAPQIPVSDQTPAVSAPVTAAIPGGGPSSAPAASPTASNPAGAGGPVGGGGFAPIPSGRAQDLKAQGQYQQESMTAAFGPTNGILEKSMMIQDQQLTVLKSILVAAESMRGGRGAAAAGEAAQGATAQAAGPRQPARSPVSMAK